MNSIEDHFSDTFIRRTDPAYEVLSTAGRKSKCRLFFSLIPLVHNNWQKPAFCKARGA